jgi:hypothetical protein
MPDPFMSVINFVLAVIYCAIFLCILAWLLHWGKEYVTFLPWP